MGQAGFKHLVLGLAGERLSIKGAEVLIPVVVFPDVARIENVGIGGADLHDGDIALLLKPLRRPADGTLVAAKLFGHNIDGADEGVEVVTVLGNERIDSKA